MTCPNQSSFRLLKADVVKRNVTRWVVLAGRQRGIVIRYSQAVVKVDLPSQRRASRSRHCVKTIKSFQPVKSLLPNIEPQLRETVSSCMSNTTANLPTGTLVSKMCLLGLILPSVISPFLGNPSLACLLPSQKYGNENS